MGSLSDTSIGIGYQFYPFARMAITPLAGFSYHRQKLNITDGYQSIWTDDPSLVGPFCGLDSYYEAVWRSPWVGVDLSMQVDRRTNVCLSVEYHWADYRGEGNWNLRNDLAHPKSFTHDADGYGLVFSGGADWLISKQWSFGVLIEYQKWTTNSGTDHMIGAGGSTVDLPFNEANWKSTFVGLKLIYSFPFTTWQQSH